MRCGVTKSKQWLLDFVAFVLYSAKLSQCRSSQCVAEPELDTSVDVRSIV